MDEELRSALSRLQAERKVSELVVVQRDRARQDLEIFAREFQELRRKVTQMPRWLRRMYKLDKEVPK
jgi:hypothetical protein